LEATRPSAVSRLWLFKPKAVFMLFGVENISVQKLITSSLSKKGIIGFSLLFILFIDFLDFLVGGLLHLSVFLLAPVALVTWNVGLRSGLALATLSASYLILDYLIHPILYPHPWIVLWDTAAVIFYFAAICFILAALKSELEKAHQKSKIDALTGLLSSSAFFEAAEAERERSVRYGHPFTLCFLDLDNFKKINDTHGHLMGDKLLRKVSAILKDEVRSSDLVGRIGGDEFVVLFPETGPEAAESLSLKLQRAVDEGIQEEMPLVTLSMGVATYFDIPDKIDDIVHGADLLMYEAKKSGKNIVRCKTFGSPAAVSR
jgi:diguanylate cyclase (GGDEF)-like protein